MKRRHPEGDADAEGEGLGAKRSRASSGRHVARHVAVEPTGGAEVALLSEQRETDARRLAQRQKQLDYGKNTLGYDRYCAQVPRHRRRKGDPETPDKAARVSKKQFDHQVRRWRQALHRYDPPELAQQLEQQLERAEREQHQQQPRQPKQEEPPAKDQDEASDGAGAGRSIFDNFDEADNDAKGQAVEEEEEDDDDDLL